MNSLEAEFLNRDPDSQVPKRALNHGKFYDDRDEYVLDAVTYAKGSRMHTLSPFHSAIRKYLIEAVFQTEPEFFRRGSKTRIVDREFSDAFKDEWITAMKEALGEIWTLGIVPIRLEERSDGIWIPRVQKSAMGKDYEITVQRERPTGRRIYRFYRIKLKNGAVPTQPREDHNVMIFDGFEADPTVDGRLNSVTASLLSFERHFQLNYDYNLKAIHSMAAPPLVTETDNQAWGTALGEDVYETYAGQDAIDERSRAHFKANASQRRELNAHQMAQYDDYLKRYEEEQVNPKRLGMPFHNNHFWLPPHHKLARPQGAQGRGDWDKFHQIFEDVQATAYSVPRELVFSAQSARFQVSTITADAKLVKVVNRKREDLGRILTALYRRAHPEDGEVEIRFRKLPFVSYETLERMYSLGALSFDGYVRSTMELTGLDKELFNPKAKPPEGLLAPPPAKKPRTSQPKNP